MWKSTKSNAPKSNAPAASHDEVVSSCAFAEGLDPRQEDYSVIVLDRILRAAVAARATDVHFELQTTCTLLRWRVDGTLIDLGQVANGQSTSLLNRLKALARLVTYRSDIPQEGRMILPEFQLEARVGTLPTLHGERAVVRLAVGSKTVRTLDELGLDDFARDVLCSAVSATSGVILITGPAGAGKTTTAYACLRAIADSDQSPRSLVTLEDPIEIEFPGAAQSQINPAVGYDWASGLKALLRQDPEVMLVGEIRDAATATMVFDAAMTGQLVLTTMHARSASDALRRLLDMQVPAHHLLSGLGLLINQRLLRRLCTATQHETGVDCPTCDGMGYTGRFLLAEVMPRIEMELARAVMTDADSHRIEAAAIAAGMRSLEMQAAEAVAQQRTTSSELKRHFTR